MPSPPAQVLERFAANLLQLFLGKHLTSGTVDYAPPGAALAY